jgi:hypothetical protein
MVGSSDPALTLSTKSSPEFLGPDHPATGRFIRQATEGFRHIGRIIRPRAKGNSQADRIIRPGAEDIGWQAGSSGLGPDHPSQMNLEGRFSQ